MIIIVLLILFYIVVTIGVIYMIKIAKVFFELKDFEGTVISVVGAGVIIALMAGFAKFLIFDMKGIDWLY